MFIQQQFSKTFQWALDGNKEIPILGINTGRLGFLADISPDQMEETFDEIYQGMYLAEPRRVL